MRNWTTKEAKLALEWAREPVKERSHIDEIAATSLQNQRGIAPNDLAAIQGAASEVAALDNRQAERINAIQQRLGL